MSEIHETIEITGGKLFVENKETKKYDLLGDVISGTVTTGLNPEFHEKLRKVCKFFAFGFDSYADGLELTCRHPRNKPEGSSWGICDHKKCPLAAEF